MIASWSRFALACASSRAAMAASRSAATRVVVVGRGARGGEPLVGLLELDGEAAHGGLLAGDLGAQRRDLLGGDALARRGARWRRGRLRGLRAPPPRGRGGGRLGLGLGLGLRRAAPRVQRAFGGRRAPLAGNARHGQVDRQARRDGELGRGDLELLALPREGGDPLVAVLGGPRLVVEDGQQASLLVGRLHHEHRAHEAVAAQPVPAAADLEAVAVDPLEAVHLEGDAIRNDLRSGHASPGHSGPWLPDRPLRSTRPTCKGRNASRRLAR